MRGIKWKRGDAGKGEDGRRDRLYNERYAFKVRRCMVQVGFCAKPRNGHLEHAHQTKGRSGQPGSGLIFLVSSSLVF
jgi:hypothetical protein